MAISVTGCINAKQVLDLFEVSAVGKENAIDDLCLWFDQETEYGDNMTHYNKLLDAVIAHITTVAYEETESNFEERQSPRCKNLHPASKAPKDTGDFKLVTWLVIA